MDRQPKSSLQLDQDVARSLDVLDSVIGEFDDGFLSESDGHSVTVTRTERTKGQFSPNGKIDRIFDDLAKEIYDYDEKVERLNNFKICSRDKVIGGREDDKNPCEIPAPGSFMVAKQLYLDNLDRVGREENIAGGKSERPNVIRKEMTGDQAAPRTAVGKVRSQAPVSNEEKAVISELKQQVSGKEGKFIKVTGARSNNNKHESGKKHKSDKCPSHPHPQSQSPLTGDYFPAKPGDNGRTKPSQRNRNKASQAAGQDSSHQSRQSRSKSLDVVQHQRTGAERHRRRQPTQDLEDLSEDEIFLREQRPHQRQSRSRQRPEERKPSRVSQSNGWFINTQHQLNSRGGGPFSSGQRQTERERDRRVSMEERERERDRRASMEERERDRRVSMEERQRDSRVSMAWDSDLPPHLRQYLNDSSSTNAFLLNLPAYIDEQLRYEHQMNIEAQRDLLRQRGFPASHPLLAGEIPIHPELVGHLHFGKPNQTTVALNHEDFVRFLPEMQRRGMKSSFPKSSSDLHDLTEVRGQGESDNVTRRNRSRSTEPRHQRPRSMFNPLSSRDRQNINNDNLNHRSYKKPWHPKETGDLVHVNGRTDSGIGEELWRSSNQSDKTSSNKSSFGMILKDRFQKNPNMYFPDTSLESNCQLSPGVSTKAELERDSDWSDSDTLVHNMSEGSFDKDSGLSAGQSSNSHSTGEHDLESLLSGARSRSITTPIKPVQTAVVLQSNPSVILDKKTLRNYTPRESSCLLRQFEEERLYSSRETGRPGVPTPSPSTQFSSLTSRRRNARGSSDTSGNIDTCRSQMSCWSFASSAASFDWHAGGAEITKASPSSLTASGSREESDGELDNLKKLLKEGRIAGLDDKPPSFTPPSPPGSKKKKAPSPREQSEKRLAPQPPRHPPGQTSLQPRQPPEDLKAPPPSSTVQFLGGRRVHSVENICTDSGTPVRHVSADPNISRDPRPSQQSDNLKRSTSMHGQNSSKEFLGKSTPARDSSLAQLIADSTEKKFRFNSLFKGIWKKKQYTLDA